MSSDIVFIVPGRLDQLTGGYLFERHIVEGLRTRGRSVRVIELSAHDPMAANTLIGGLPDGTKTVVDGLALANLGQLVAAQARRVRLISFFPGPPAQETRPAPAPSHPAAPPQAGTPSQSSGGICPSKKKAHPIPE